MDKHIYDKKEPIQHTSDIIDTKLGQEEFFDLFIVLGIMPELFNPKDPSDDQLSYWEHKKNGKPVFDANFDLSSEQNQKIMMEFC